MNVCIDTCALIYALNTESKKPDISGKPENQRALKAIESAQAHKATLVIPTVVLSEVLYGFEEEDEPEMLKTLRRAALIPEFDIKTALIAGRIGARLRGLKRPKGVSGPAFRVDILVAAAAIASGARFLITYDKQFNSLLAGSPVAPIQDLPLPVQQHPPPAQQPRLPIM
jgi:predicted nucleic acid-binding protein